MTNAVTIRLGLDGGRDVEEGLRKIGEVSKEQFARAEKAADDASKMVARYAETAKATAEKIKGLKGDFDVMRGNAAQGFAAGGEAGVGGIASQIYQAGGIKNFAAMNGGALMAGSMVAGAAWSGTKMLAELNQMAKEAGVTASEMLGLQKAMEKVGYSSNETGQLLSVLKTSMLEARANTGELKDVMAQYNIALTDSNGAMRPTSAILQELSRAIASATTEEEKLKIATAAVGEEMAQKLVDAVKKGGSAMTDFSSITMQASSSIINDAARMASSVVESINKMMTALDNYYARAKQVLGLELTPVDKVKAAESEITELQGRLKFTQAMGAHRGATPEENEAAVTKNLADLLAAGERLQKLRTETGTSLRTLEGTYPGLAKKPEVKDDEKPDVSRGGGGRAARAAENNEEVSNYEQLRKALADVEAQVGMTDRAKFIAAQTSKLNENATDEERASLAALAGQYYDVKNAATAAQAAQQNLSGDLKGVAQGFIQGAIQGKGFSDTLKNIGSQLTNKLLSRLLDGLFSSGGSGFGNLFASGPAAASAPSGFMGLFAEGGSIPAGGWGIAGERQPEIVMGPARVMSSQEASGFGAAPINIVSNVHNSSGAPVDQQATRGPSGEIMINTVVGAVMDRLSDDLDRNGPYHRQVAGRFGLNRSGGGL